MIKYEKFATLLAIGFLILTPGLQAEDMVVQRKATDVIDTPTADVVDHYGYQVSFRFGKEGNLQTKTAFGVFPRLNLGFGLDGEKVIGTESARMNKPSINLKFRFFDGQGILPAFAIGFDSQGYVFNKTIDEYEQREKGFYLVATKEIFFPEFMFHAGVNKFDFDESDTTRAWGALSYVYQHKVGVMAEYDHATIYKERRVNYGLKYFVTPAFTVEAVGRNTRKTPTSSARETERIVRLCYTGSF